MMVSKQKTGPRKPTNISLASDIIEEARELNINVSRACERGLVEAIGEARRRLWLKENEAALASSNAFVEANGLPLRRHRRF
jgi:antitoxin CcdA